MSNESAIGSFFEGMALGARSKSILSRRDRGDDGDVPLPATIRQAKAETGEIDSGGPAKAVPLKSPDPVATDLAPHQRAFLNAVSDGESAGKYNVRYTPKGGAEFSDLSKHPGIFEPGPHGPSSAAGRYQFTKTTWDRLGGGDFSPENQDRRAWKLATMDYNARTGRDLDADLKSGGLTPKIMSVLQPTWTSFGAKGSQRIRAYESSLGRYANDGAPASKSIARPTEADEPGAIGIMGELFPASRSVMDMG